jgi:P4 family phage/plasmid primase-like protien
VVGAWDPEVIDQAIPLLPEQARNGHHDAEGEPPVELDPEARKVWQGERPKLKDTGAIDRSSSLVKIGRALYDAGATRPAIVASLAERDQALGWRKYAGRHDAEARYHEIVDELESNGRNARVRVTFGDNGHRKVPWFNLTDLGNAGRFIHRHGRNLRYCWPWGKWLVWDGRRWARDDTGEVFRLAKETVASIYQEAAAAPDDETRKILAKHAMRSESGARIKEMVDLARSDVPVRPEELDASGDLFNVENGTIDLRYGDLREHRPEDLITKLAPTTYDPGAKAPLWSAALERVLPSPALREFFQKLCGSAFTGDTSEHILPVLYGTGANGKSTVLNALLAVAGDYGMQAAPDLLVTKRNSHPTELADLFGMRFVASIEVEDGRKLAESLVKQLTGGDRIKARRMRQDFWEFEPTHTVFMACNHKPIVRGTDTAIWRRIRLIPFTQTIAPADQDKQLPAKLRMEMPGILAWAVKGCLAWRREGLQAPEEVRRATAGYRSEMDVIGDFLADRCFRGERLKVAKDELYKAYQVWCEDAGERAETKRKFGMLLKDRGIEDGRNAERTQRIWKGIGLSRVARSVPGGGDAGDVSGDRNSSKSPGFGEASGHNDAEMPLNTRNHGSREANSEIMSEASEASEEQERRVSQLVYEGMSEEIARRQVLGKHLESCLCEECVPE